MNITRSTDFELITRLNKPIHELHASLYPEYFTEYNFEAIRDSFEKLVQTDSFIFLLLEDANEPFGYAWNYIYDLAREQSIETVELDYWANNEIAKKFYSKQGFTGYREFVYRSV